MVARRRRREPVRNPANVENVNFEKRCYALLVNNKALAAEVSRLSAERARCERQINALNRKLLKVDSCHKEKQEQSTQTEDGDTVVAETVVAVPPSALSTGGPQLRVSPIADTVRPSRHLARISYAEPSLRTKMRRARD